MDQRDKQMSGNIKSHGNSRVYTRNQDAIKNNSYNSPSYSKSKKSPKESMNKNSQGWNNGSSVRPSSKRRPSSYCDNSSVMTTDNSSVMATDNSSVMATDNSSVMATDDDVIWYNDKLNEDKNKMGRTETWVLDQRRNRYYNKNKRESDRKTYFKNKVSDFSNSYDPHHEVHTRDKNHRSYHRSNHRSSYSNYKESGRGTLSERSKQGLSKDTYPSKNRHEPSSKFKEEKTLPPELQFCNLSQEEKDKYPISDRLLIIAQYGPPYEKFVADQLARHGYQRKKGKDDALFTEKKAVEKSGKKSGTLHSLAKNSHSSPVLEINLCTSDESTGAEDNDTAKEN